MLKSKEKGEIIMLVVSLLFSTVMLVSFDSLAGAFIATIGWIAVSFLLFSGSAF